MKFNPIDILLNITDGIDKYKTLAAAVFAFLLGAMALAVTFAHWGAFWLSCAGAVGALAGFWRVGRPK